MKKKWISISRLKRHEFHSTLRHIRLAGESPHTVYLKLGELEKDIAVKIAKQASALLLFYLLLSTFGDDRSVSITVQSVTASVPASFVALTASILLLVLVLNLISLLQVINAIVDVGSRIERNGFSSRLYRFYHGQDDTALAMPSFSSLFLREVIPVSKFLSNLSMLAFSTLLIPFFGFGYYLIVLHFRIIERQPALSMDGMISLMGLWTIFVSATFLVLFFLPLPMRKNARHIRWVVLAKLAPGLHPMSKKWRNEEDS